jgi:hypothetical protein
MGSFSRRGRILRPAFLILGTLSLCSSLFSQGAEGRILGVVTDQSGAAVPNASVTVADSEGCAT